MFLKIYLFQGMTGNKGQGKESGEEWERTNLLFSVYSLSTCSNCTGNILKPGAQNSTLVAGSRVLRSFAIAFPNVLTESWIESGISGTWTNLLIWNACVSMKQELQSLCRRAHGMNEYKHHLTLEDLLKSKECQIARNGSLMKSKAPFSQLN